MKILFIILTVSLNFALSQEIVQRNWFSPDKDTTSTIQCITEYKDHYYVLTDIGYGLYKCNKPNFSECQLVTKIKRPEGVYQPSNQILTIKNDTITLFRLNALPPSGKPNIIKYSLKDSSYTNFVADSNSFNLVGVKHMTKSIDENNFFAYYHFDKEIEDYAQHRIKVYKNNLNTVQNIEIDKDTSKYPIEKVYNIEYENDIFTVNGMYDVADDNLEKTFFMEFDSEGNKLQETSISFEKDFPIEHIKRFGDKLYFFAQDTADKRNEYNELPKHIICIVTDTNGVILNENTYSFNVFNALFVRNLTTTSDGGFLVPVTSTLYHPDNPDSPVAEAMDSYLVKTDSLGNPEWNVEIRTKYKRDIIRHIIEEKNGYISLFNSSGSGYNAKERIIEFIRIKSPQTGIKTFSTQTNIEIYPNPANDHLNVNINDYNYISYEIYDLMGRMLLRNNLNNRKIDISGLTSGNYILRLFNDKIGEWETIGFIKK